MAASLPEATAMPVRSWSTVTFWRGRKRMLEPPTRAVGWTRMLVVRFSRPILMRSMTTYMVMTLVREAGGMERLGLYSYSTLPVFRLIMTAARALRAASAPAGSESMARTSSRTHSQRPGREGEWCMCSGRMVVGLMGFFHSLHGDGQQHGTDDEPHGTETAKTAEDGDD